MIWSPIWSPERLVVDLVVVDAVTLTIFLQNHGDILSFLSDANEYVIPRKTQIDALQWSGKTHRTAQYYYYTTTKPMLAKH